MSNLLASLAIRAAAAVCVVAVLPAGALQAAQLTVPGTSNPWLAGLPDGSTEPFGDVAPLQSPVLVVGGPVVPGAQLRFTVTGSVSNGPCCAFTAPDGGEWIQHGKAAGSAVGGARAPVNALVGVFLADGVPTSPWDLPVLDYESIGTDFFGLAVGLSQVFFIGDGLTGHGSGAVQRFEVPAGATRLALGTMDGYEWNNNLGAYEVTVTSAVPEPAGWGTALAGVCCVAVAIRRTSRRRAVCKG